MMSPPFSSFLFFFNDTATTEIYTLPYTTLFRSLARARQALLLARNDRQNAALALLNAIGANEADDVAPTDTPVPVTTIVKVDTDRKSTRLNSSHGYISYAVFCLKKKKTTDESHAECNHSLVAICYCIVLFCAHCHRLGILHP